MADSFIKKKEQKFDIDLHVICRRDSPSCDLVTPKDASPWYSLCEAATIKHFDPILNLKIDNPNTVPNEFYHHECRSNFSYKELTKLRNITGDCEDECVEPKQSLHRGTTEKQCVYEKICIFCQSSPKGLKGASTRKTLIQAVDLMQAQKLFLLHLEKVTKILAITSQDIAAAEAYYHVHQTTIKKNHLSCFSSD